MARKTSFLAGAVFAAATVVAPFSALAEKPAHPLLDPSTTASAYAADVLKIAGRELGPPGATRGGAALVRLEDALRKGPRERPYGIVFPGREDPSTRPGVISFALPGERMWATASIPFCIQKSYEDARILAVGSIPPDGHVRELAKESFNGMSCAGFMGSPTSQKLLTTEAPSYTSPLAVRP